MGGLVLPAAGGLTATAAAAAAVALEANASFASSRRQAAGNRTGSLERTDIPAVRYIRHAVYFVISCLSSGPTWYTSYVSCQQQASSDCL